jgi:hypothetical protein
MGQDLVAIRERMEADIESTATRFLTIGAAIEARPAERTLTFRFQTESTIPSIPGTPDSRLLRQMYAAGTPSAAGGWSLVGEEGPSLCTCRKERRS